MHNFKLSNWLFLKFKFQIHLKINIIFWTLLIRKFDHFQIKNLSSKCQSKNTNNFCNSCTSENTSRQSSRSHYPVNYYIHLNSNIIYLVLYLRKHERDENIFFILSCIIAGSILITNRKIIIYIVFGWIKLIQTLIIKYWFASIYKYPHSSPLWKNTHFCDVCIIYYPSLFHSLLLCVSQNICIMIVFIFISDLSEDFFAEGVFSFTAVPFFVKNEKRT